MTRFNQEYLKYEEERAKGRIRDHSVKCSMKKKKKNGSDINNIDEKIIGKRISRKLMEKTRKDQL